MARRRRRLMRRATGSFDEMVRAFRDATDTATDGGATRTRVLVGAARAVRRRTMLRRFGLAIAAIFIATSSVSATLTVARRLWGAPASLRLGAGDEGSDGTHWRAADHALRVIPPAAVGDQTTAASIAGLDDVEARAYGHAHRLHFLDD